MSGPTTYSGLQGGSLVNPGTLLRVTFTRILPFALGDNLNDLQGAYNKVAELAPVNADCFVASPFSAAPEADSFTVDVRMQNDAAARTVEHIASTLDAILTTYDVSRVASISKGEGSNEAAETRATEAAAEDAEPGFVEAITAGAQQAQSTLKLLLWVVVMLVVVYLVYPYLPKKAGK